MLDLRWYQKEAVAACWSFLCGQPGNPLIVLPTGAGKSIVIAKLCEDAVKRWNGTVIVLAHRKELLEQNADKIRKLLPDMDVGIYSAGLKSRDTDCPIVVAGIQSAYDKAFEFGRRNLCIIDESHLVPFDGEGMYRTFLTGMRTATPGMRTVGTTATPFRLDAGPLCRPDGVFQRVCYSAPIQRLIADGYLCNLTTRPAESSVDTSALHVRGGEFVNSESVALFDRAEEVNAACREIVAKTVGRQSVLIFCSGVLHAEHVARMIAELTGEPCGVVTGESMPLERAETLDAFRSRRLRFLCNVDVLTTGFDAPCIDAIAILRATMSAGLFAQICGRGFRVFPGKADCLVLDFGENLKRHGPIDSLDFGRCKRHGDVIGEAPTKTCPNCEEVLLIAARECECGYQFPEPESRHGTEADEDSQILSTPQAWIVEEVRYSRHDKKKGGPDDPPTLRVDYVVTPENSEGGNLEIQTVSEWVCIEHGGFARSKALRWWNARSIAPCPVDVDEAVRLGLGGALAWPRKIVTIKDGRWTRVLSADLEEKPAEWITDVMEDWDEVPF